MFGLSGLVGDLSCTCALDAGHDRGGRNQPFGADIVCRWIEADDVGRRQYVEVLDLDSVVERSSHHLPNIGAR